jgi:DNA-binding NtrC family response regulator
MGKKIILIVDDEQEQRFFYQDFLISEGYTVITANNPVEALKLVKAEDVSLIITDYRMPKLDGANFTELIKEQCPNLPFLMISGYPVEARETFQTCAFAPDLIIEKPVQRQELLQAVKQLFDKTAHPSRSAAS